MNGTTQSDLPRRRRHAPLAAGLVFIVALASIPSPSAGDKKQAARSKLVTIRRQIVQKQAVLRRTKQAQRQVSAKIRESREGLHSAQARLRGIRAQLADAEAELRDSERRLAKAQARLATHVSLLRGRLVDIYKHGTADQLTVLLQARDAWDLTSRGYLLQRVVAHDVELLDRIRKEKAVVAAETERQRTYRDRVARLRVQAQREIVDVGERLSIQRQVQEDLRRERARQEAALAELAENSRQVEAMLRAFEARSDVARQIPHPWTGSFARPVSGRITSRFGMRYHPVLRVTKLHTGVDIAAPSGTPIHAAGDGVVVHAGRWGGYGNCVVVAHGNGRSTLYAHCSSLAVSSGQRVRRGQTIGRVGSTGYSTGPHLHFEVRKNGAPVNPLSH